MATKNSRYTAFTLICRFYMTIVTLIMAALSDHDLQYVAILIAIGLALDGLRHWLAPDVARGFDFVVGELAEAKTPNQTDRNDNNISLRICGYWYGAYVLYVLFLFVAPSWVGEEVLGRYLRFFSPAYEVIGHWVSAIPRHAFALNAAGYPDRALLAQHHYAAFFLFVLLSTFYISTLALPLLVEGVRGRVKRGEANPGTAPISMKLILGFVIAAIAFYAVPALVVTVDFEPHSRPWNTHISDFPYFILVLAACATSMWTCLLYLLLLRLRERTWIGVPATTNTSVAPSSVGRHSS